MRYRERRRVNYTHPRERSFNGTRNSIKRRRYRRHVPMGRNAQERLVVCDVACEVVRELRLVVW